LRAGSQWWRQRGKRNGLIRSLQERGPGGRGSGARCAHHHSLCKRLCWGSGEPTVTLHRSLRFGMVVFVVAMNFPYAFVSFLPCPSLFSLSCICLGWKISACMDSDLPLFLNRNGRLGEKMYKH
jgi:hypothetical protein